jgi:hypothetical protein
MKRLPILPLVVLFIAADLAAAPGKKTTVAGKKPTAAAPRAQKPDPVLSDPRFPLDPEGRVLARTLADLWTRDAGRLVSVLGAAYSERPIEVPLTFMLAIAHAETNGRILIVSTAGAVGLAQATPIAYVREGGTGKLYVTDDYATGAWAYIMKKPLNDADHIATILAADPSDSTRAQCIRLLDAAFDYREEGIDELSVLSIWAGPGFEQRIAAARAENERVLEELRDLIAGGAGPTQLIPFRDMARERYRALRDLQRITWTAYQRDLVQRRDALLKENPAANAYEAGEMLAQELDARFSPSEMARFLRDHIQTKTNEAKAIVADGAQLERITAGLYNGGAHNLKRMQAGLITRLPETENYMVKVPATRRKLDEALARRAHDVAEMPRSGDPGL